MAPGGFHPGELRRNILIRPVGALSVGDKTRALAMWRRGMCIPATGGAGVLAAFRGVAERFARPRRRRTRVLAAPNAEIPRIPQARHNVRGIYPTGVAVKSNHRFPGVGAFHFSVRSIFQRLIRLGPDGIVFASCSALVLYSVVENARAIFKPRP